MRERVVRLIEAALIEQIHQLRLEPKCEQCPEGDCRYCEVRGALALLARRGRAERPVQEASQETQKPLQEVL